MLPLSTAEMPPFPELLLAARFDQAVVDGADGDELARPADHNRAVGRGAVKHIEHCARTGDRAAAGDAAIEGSRYR